MLFYSLKFLFLLAMVGCAERSEFVTLPDGTELQGKTIGNVVAFKGIRFAEPPVNKLRWAPPVPWTNPDKSATYDATEFGEVCKQFDTKGVEAGEEDCLFLNVYVNMDERHNSNGSLPVGFFIHGGSYMNGAASIYNGVDFVNYWKGSKIIVTTNYRLNVFGFSGSEQLRGQDAALGSTGNYGLQDQRMAMQWVQDNIAAFGGDASNVVIYGESAGAGSISNHLVMKRSWGLFHGAMLESGSFSAWVTQYMDVAQGAFDRLSTQLGCDAEKDEEVSCLLQLSTDEIFGASLDAFSTDVTYGTPYNPTADGVELMTHPWVSLTAGDVADVPVLHGSNTDEGSMFVGLPTTLTEKELDKYWRSFNYTAAGVAKLTSLYVTDKTYPVVDVDIGDQQPTVYWWAAMRSITDIAFSCPSRAVAHALSDLEKMKKRSSKSFLYHFEYLADSSLVPYVEHTAELRFVFHWKAYLQSAADLAMGDAMSSYWGNFMESGDPNGAQPDGTALPKWEAYDSASDDCLITPQGGPSAFSMQSGLKQEECAYENARNDLLIRKMFAA